MTIPRRSTRVESTPTKVSLELGEPQVAGPLAVFPVLGRQPRLPYMSLARALHIGAVVTEVDEQGSVGDVLVLNKTHQALLVYEGEEIHGARQNRTFDAPALIPAGASLTLAVSCIEEGRWEGGRSRGRFSAAPHAADPELRRIKRSHANRSARRGETPRAEQGEVWQEVASRLSLHGVVSHSSALSDVYRAKRSALDELRLPIRHARGQVGAIVEVSGRPVALDLVSREEVFAELLARLADGYALQALNAVMAGPSTSAARGFLAAALEARRAWLPTPGMGDAFAISQEGIDGSGLTAGGELVTLSAFPTGVLGDHAQA